MRTAGRRSRSRRRRWVWPSRQRSRASTRPLAAAPARAHAAALQPLSTPRPQLAPLASYASLFRNHWVEGSKWLAQKPHGVHWVQVAKGECKRVHKAEAGP
eukprot:6204965-Pleurochrysis_carterae.AAC.5